MRFVDAGYAHCGTPGTASPAGPADSRRAVWCTTADRLSFAHALSLRLSREPLIGFVRQIDPWSCPCHTVPAPHETRPCERPVMDNLVSRGSAGSSGRSEVLGEGNGQFVKVGIAETLELSDRYAVAVYQP